MMGTILEVDYAAVIILWVMTKSIIILIIFSIINTTQRSVLYSHDIIVEFYCTSGIICPRQSALFDVCLRLLYFW